jgi:diadenosine tetraphosphate (Ap4A) HIT family hydrolase
LKKTSLERRAGCNLAIMSAADCPFCRHLNRLANLPPGELVWEFPHSVALLGNWQIFPGYCVLIARTHATELFQLPPAERKAYLDEMCLLAAAIDRAFTPRKLNYELLGNQVPHLHWHLFPRPDDDSDPFRAVWFAIERAKDNSTLDLQMRCSQRSRAETTDRLRATIREMAGHWT